MHDNLKVDCPVMHLILFIPYTENEGDNNVMRVSSDSLKKMFPV